MSILELLQTLAVVVLLCVVQCNIAIGAYAYGELLTMFDKQSMANVTPFVIVLELIVSLVVRDSYVNNASQSNHRRRLVLPALQLAFIYGIVPMQLYLMLDKGMVFAYPIVSLLFLGLWYYASGRPWLQAAERSAAAGAQETNTKVE